MRVGTAAFAERLPSEQLQHASRRIALRAAELGRNQRSLLRRGTSRGFAVLCGYGRLTVWRSKRFGLGFARGLWCAAIVSAALVEALWSDPRSVASRRRLGSLLCRLLRARGLRRALPIGAVVLASVACQFVTGDEGESGEPPAGPSLEKSKAMPPPPKISRERAPKNGPWSYVLPVDHGVRSDKSGMGHFRAPRYHGEHNGIDLLAPVGTPVFAACAGRAMAGASKSFGLWVHLVCPVPKDLASKGSPYASFFYAHLSKNELPHNQWVRVRKAQSIGAVGKSGNARGDNVQPHLHLELIIQKDRRAAMDERHLGNDQSMVPDAKRFLSALDERCLEPNGFHPKSGALRRARRFDPFVALTCLSGGKPDFERAPRPLDFASNAWSEFYLADGFNVDEGPDGLLLAEGR